MLETPLYPQVLAAAAAVKILVVRTISRKDLMQIRNPQRLYARPQKERFTRMI